MKTRIGSFSVVTAVSVPSFDNDEFTYELHPAGHLLVIRRRAKRNEIRIHRIFAVGHWVRLVEVAA